MNPENSQTNMENSKAMDELKRRIEELEHLMRTHTHSGTDGSDFIYSDTVKTKTGSQLSTGKISIQDALSDDGTSEFGFFILGNDAVASDGIDNAQLTLNHLPLTNGTTNQTFFYGIRPPLFGASDGTVVAGSNKIFTNQFKFGRNALIGARVNVYDPVNVGFFHAADVVSNDEISITLDSAPPFSAVSNAYFSVTMPIYLGAADYPWRRVYTTSTLAGGIRFGGGSTGDGQNGILFMGATGGLYWSDVDGTVTQLA